MKSMKTQRSMKVTKSTRKKQGGIQKLASPPPLPRRREREGRKNVPQEGSAPNPVDTILMYFFIFYNFGIRWGRKRSLDPSPIQDAPFQLKSLGPIHFVKIRLSNFLSNEFLVKMYTL